MIVAIACDHAGLPLKKIVMQTAQSLGHEALDFGTNNCDSVDYPDYAAPAAQAIVDGRAQRAILLCGSGIGMCLAANKFKGVRASVAYDVYSAAQGVEHDGMNVLCLGAKVVGDDLAAKLVQAFLNARFLAGEERFARRARKLNDIETKNFK